MSAFGDPLDPRTYNEKLADWLAAAFRPASHECEPIHPTADHCRCGADLRPADLKRTA